MIYRILTENKNRQGIENILNRRFSGYTIIESTGYWETKRENSLIVEIDSLDQHESTVRISVYSTAREIKNYNGQESVLVQEITSHSKLVS